MVLTHTALERSQLRPLAKPIQQVLQELLVLLDLERLRQSLLVVAMSLLLVQVVQMFEVL